MAKLETLLAWGAYNAQRLYNKSGTYYNNGSFLQLRSGLHKDLTPICNGKLLPQKIWGFDYGLLKGKITGSIDLYEKTTTARTWYSLTVWRKQLTPADSYG